MAEYICKIKNPLSRALRKLIPASLWGAPAQEIEGLLNDGDIIGSVTIKTAEIGDGFSVGTESYEDCFTQLARMPKDAEITMSYTGGLNG